MKGGEGGTTAAIEPNKVGWSKSPSGRELTKTLKGPGSDRGYHELANSIRKKDGQDTVHSRTDGRTTTTIDDSEEREQYTSCILHLEQIRGATRWRRQTCGSVKGRAGSWARRNSVWGRPVSSFHFTVFGRQYILGGSRLRNHESVERGVRGTRMGRMW